MRNNNAENRKLTLEVSGLSTDSFVSLKLANGEEVQVNGGELIKALGNNVNVGGNIANEKLYRRWVMAQWFRQYNSKAGYAATVAKLPVSYQWKMISEELKVLAKLEKTDVGYFNERSTFFNIEIISGILNEYLSQLTKTVDHLKVKKCKKVPYVHVGGQDIFVDDLNRKLYTPLRQAISKFETAQDYTAASRAFEVLKRNHLQKYHLYRKNAFSSFLDAYKGAGAYYTLQNMVLYHNCALTEYTSDMKPVKTYTGTAAYEFMKSKLDEYRGEGWRWTGVLRQCIKDNNFSFGTVA